MKKLFVKNAFILAAVCSVLVFSFSCTKDKPEYKVIVTVKYLSDTVKFVPGAAITISKNDIEVEGFTDDAGQFMANFDNEMILDILASIDTGSVGNPQFLEGMSTVRLQKDKTVYRTVFLD